MKLLRVRQKLVSNPIADVPAAVRAALDGLKLKVPQGEVGITAGSRGIANIAAVTRTAGDWLRQHGARPFLFPAMGSHNGGTAEGQRAMVESLGMTDHAEATDMIPLTPQLFGDEHRQPPPRSQQADAAVGGFEMTS